MTAPSYVTPCLTRSQAQVAIDALDLYTEGAQGQQTAREIRDARAARKKLRWALADSSSPDSVTKGDTE